MNLLTKIIFIVLLGIASHTQANEFIIGLSYANSKIYPMLRIKISQGMPNNTNKFRPNEKHHGYIGAGIWLTGLALTHRSLGKKLMLVGELLIIDDAIQHIMRVDSPLHNLNDYLWKYSWYRSCIK